jgi:hypothetical protein
MIMTSFQVFGVGNYLKGSEMQCKEIQGMKAEFYNGEMWFAGG